MEIGGAEISLIGLLQSIDYSMYDVDLFVYSHRGELMKFIPNEVNLLPEIASYSMIEKPLKEVLLKGHVRVFLSRMVAKWKYSRYAKRNHPKEGSAIFQYVDSEVCKVLPSLHKYGTYDLAISFLTPHKIVLDKVLAKKKVAWIHTDYGFIDVDVEKELPVWSCYDYIASISESVKTNFLKCFPSLSSRIIDIENILSSNFVEKRANLLSEDEVEKEMPRREGTVNLLSVGRFTHAKNYDNVPEICRQVLKTGVDIRWYIIGYGGEESLIRQKIEDCGMQNHVILLGKKDNPYPYIKACDVYVQPSRFEGKSVTVREAQMLCKPVIVTDYATASSQISDGNDGVIVPLENDGCARGISAFLLNKTLQARIVSYLKEHDYSNSHEVVKLYELIKSI